MSCQRLTSSNVARYVVTGVEFADRERTEVRLFSIPHQTLAGALAEAKDVLGVSWVVSANVVRVLDGQVMSEEA